MPINDDIPAHVANNLALISLYEDAVIELILQHPEWTRAAQPLRGEVELALMSFYLDCQNEGALLEQIARRLHG